VFGELCTKPHLFVGIYHFGMLDSEVDLLAIATFELNGSRGLEPQLVLVKICHSVLI